MRWQNKARIMKIFSVLPSGPALYKILQRTLGRLRANHSSRLPVQVEMGRWLLDSGLEIADKVFFEVGTGHIPILPIGYFLCGAAKVITVDLNRRVEWQLTRDSLTWLALHKEEARNIVQDIVNADLFEERFKLLSRYQDSPEMFFKEAKIEYLAPKDASKTDLDSESIDCHFSVTTLEHIPMASIKKIFQEARRILKPNGVAIHFIDTSDHFQHQDPTISKINFLQFSEREWLKIAANEFGYCNRIRASQFRQAFQQLGFTVNKQNSIIDPECLALLEGKSLNLDPAFESLSQDDISTVAYHVLLTKEGFSGGHFG